MPCVLPLFDPKSKPQAWNERMKPGEYAVHYAGFQPPNDAKITDPFCTVFSSLEAAEDYAKGEVTRYPTLLCRIYDHQGLSQQPLREIKGSEFKGEPELSARFRRWGGSILFFGGIALFIYDACKDFALIWPATFAMRMVPFGLILLATELFIVIQAKRKKEHRSPPPG